MRAVRHPLFALSVLLFAACGSDSPSEVVLPSIDGVWVGSQDGISSSVTLTGRSNGPVTGSGSVSSDGSTIAITVTGTYVHPNVTLTVEAPELQGVSFQGQLSDANTLTGTVSGAELSSFTYTVRRQ